MSVYGDIHKQRSNTVSMLSGEYFNWLCSQVCEDEPYCFGGNRYYSLLRKLHGLEFYATVDRDENRIHDGEYLRYLFCLDKGFEDDSETISEFKECFTSVSVLEVLVAFCRRIEAEILYDPEVYRPGMYLFWTMMHNADLDDPDGIFDSYKFAAIMYDILDRHYERNGNGGFFPLKNPKKDQRKVELWYQFHAYDQEVR